MDSISTSLVVALLSTSRTAPSFALIPRAVVPRFTASRAYSTWNSLPSGLNTVIALSYPVCGDCIIIISPQSRCYCIFWVKRVQRIYLFRYTLNSCVFKEIIFILKFIINDFKFYRISIFIIASPAFHIIGSSHDNMNNSFPAKEFKVDIGWSCITGGMAMHRPYRMYVGKHEQLHHCTLIG